MVYIQLASEHDGVSVLVGKAHLSPPEYPNINYWLGKVTVDRETEVKRLDAQRLSGIS
jgi:hypothetical protein